MADWRQIQARIRKAKAGTDPPAQLAALYEKTHDAMVAFELARLSEQSGQNEEAARWYTTAAQRFRRAQWKTKAEEALVRLGAPILASSAAETAAASESVTAAAVETSAAFPEMQVEQTGHPVETTVEKTDGAGEEAKRPRRRRRGRRGGRGRRRKGRAQAAPAPAEAATAPPEVARPEPARVHEVPRKPAEAGWRKESREEEEKLKREGRTAVRSETPRTPVPEIALGPAAFQVRARTGEPALASRMAHLESQLRRLISSPLCRPDDADQAPAGPGVFILSDADQSTYYYVEACQTLRIGVGNLLRGERGGSARRGGSLRARFADHLGISESRVSKYLKEHCGVRWLQLDEGAALLSHFAIAVLRPVLND